MPLQTRRRIAWPALLSLAPLAARAQDAATKLGTYTPPETQSFSPSPAWLLLRTIGSLVLVLGLLGFCAWLAKVRGGVAKTPSNGRLKVIESHALGTNRSLHLVAVGGRILLLGGGENITCLADFTAQELDWSPDEPGTPSFDSWLAKLQWPGQDQATFGASEKSA